MIFGSVINEGLKDEIVVTVIATGFNDSASTQPPKPVVRPYCESHATATTTSSSTFKAT